jgi:hypothetical protein
LPNPERVSDPRGDPEVPRGCRLVFEAPSSVPLRAAPCRDLPGRERNLLIFLAVIGIS